MVANSTGTTLEEPTLHGRIVYVENSVWTLSPHHLRTFGHAPTKPQEPARNAPPDDARFRYHEFLHAVSTLERGRGWIRRDNHCPGQWFGPGYDDAGVPELRETLTKEIHAAWQESHSWQRSSIRRPMTGRAAQAITDQLNGLRHRILFDAERLAEFADAALPPDRECYALLDVRFIYQLNQLRCHVSSSIWSAPPLHGEHCPETLRNDRASRLAGSIQDYQELFVDLARRLKAKLGQFLTMSEFRVFDRPYGLPSFWTVAPVAEFVPREPGEYLGNDEFGATLSRTLLGRHWRDDTVSHGLINGDLLILRRTARVPEYPPRADATAAVTWEVPTYLVLPASDNHAEVELRTAKLITDLTDLEADAQHQLFELQSDLEIMRNHLRVYDAIVERGSFLWDALSTHLPIGRGWGLAKAHRNIELVHQVLLQAVADLGHITSLIRQCVADVADVAARLRDRYDEQTSEWRASVGSLRPALTSTGLVERVKRVGEETRIEAERVKTAYDDLLRAFAHAFDERRVRELDGLQKAQLAVGVGAAVLGAFSIAQFTIKVDTFDMLTAVDVPGVAGDVNGAVLASWAVGLALLASMSVLWFRSARIGRLGSAWFRRFYQRGRPRHETARTITGRWRGLWSYLAATSTDRLAQFSGDARNWHELDRSLAAWLAHLWDTSARRVRRRSRRWRRDLGSLSRQLETWAAHSLIASERARRMYLYKVPNLACMYRCLVGTRNSYLEHLHASSVSAMAKADFNLSMMRLGFSPQAADAIDRWLADVGYDSATKAYQRISTLGLAAGMNQQARERALQIVGFVQA